MAEDVSELLRSLLGSLPEDERVAMRRAMNSIPYVEPSEPRKRSKRPMPTRARGTEESPA